MSGLYVSYDFFGTEPQLLSRFPNGRIDAINALAGDANVFGRVYTGFGGSAGVFADFKDVRRLS